MAMTADQETIVIYMPYPVPLEILHDLSTYAFDGIDLSTRQIITPRISVSQAGVSLLEMPDTNADTLFIGRRIPGDQRHRRQHGRMKGETVSTYVHYLTKILL